MDIYKMCKTLKHVYTECRMCLPHSECNRALETFSQSGCKIPLTLTPKVLRFKLEKQ